MGYVALCMLIMLLSLLQECGYTFVEMNASSTRSKKSIQEQVADQLKTCSILAYNTGNAVLKYLSYRGNFRGILYSLGVASTLVRCVCITAAV